MKLLLAVLVVALTGSAYAQPPQEVVPEGQISLGVGQVRVFRFDEPLARVDVTRRGIVEATKQSDRQVEINGLALGEVRMFVVSPDGRRIYDAVITVGSDLVSIGRIR